MNRAVRSSHSAAARLAYWPRRIRRHWVLFGAAASIAGVAYSLIPPPDVRHRLSMASAYSALAFLAVSLWLGPWNVLRSRANPVSFDLRRDIGIWAGLLAIFHTGVGLTVHLRGRMWMYFFKKMHPPQLQATLFGFANYTGLFAAMFFLLLLLISNDLSLRTLGVKRWKSWQRFSYFAFALAALHGAAYQAIEKRNTAWVLVFGLMVLATVTIQAFGFKRFRDRKT